MKRVVVTLLLLAGLSACGVAGDPVTPEVGVSTTVGVNSRAGAYTDTSVNIHIPLN